MPRPTKERQTAIVLRNKEIFEMKEKGYPVEFLCIHFNLDKSVISRILAKQRSLNKPNGIKQ
jgi:hypothetical protein